MFFSSTVVASVCLAPPVLLWLQQILAALIKRSPSAPRAGAYRTYLMLIPGSFYIWGKSAGQLLLWCGAIRGHRGARTPAVCRSTRWKSDRINRQNVRFLWQGPKVPPGEPWTRPQRGRPSPIDSGLPMHDDTCGWDKHSWQKKTKSAHLGSRAAHSH